MPRIGLREGNITCCEGLITARSDVCVGSNHGPLEAHQTSPGCGNLILAPSHTTLVRPQSALRRLLPKGPIVPRFVWVNQLWTWVRPIQPNSAYYMEILSLPGFIIGFLVSLLSTPMVLNVPTTPQPNSPPHEQHQPRVDPKVNPLSSSSIISSSLSSSLPRESPYSNN